MFKKLAMFFCLMGIGISMYLSYSKIVGTDLVCGVSTCGIVNSSKYAYFLGLPVAYWGLFYYLGMLLLLLINRYKLFLLGAIFGVLFSAYLTYLEIFVIHAWCQWCVLSAWITVANLIIGWRIYKKNKLAQPTISQENE